MVILLFPRQSCRGCIIDYMTSKYDIYTTPTKISNDTGERSRSVFPQQDRGSLLSYSKH